MFDVGQSSEVDDTGSTFKSYAMEVVNLKVVNDAMTQVLQMSGVASATHVIHVYRIRQQSHNLSENFNSDGDHGLGLTLLNLLRTHTMSNVLCITTRFCSPDFVHSSMCVTLP